jgi:hypothetical protein
MLRLQLGAGLQALLAISQILGFDMAVLTLAVDNASRL